MAVINAQTIYPNDAVWYRIPRVYMDDVLVTNTNPPDTFTYDVTAAAGGASVLSGTLTHSSDDIGRWEVMFNAPTAGTYAIRATVSKNSRAGHFLDSFVVTAF